MDENTKLPCGHTVAEHRKMFGQAGDLLDIQGPTKAMAAQLVAQALEHSAGSNFTAGIRALFWLVNSFDSEPEKLPPGCTTLDEGRQQAVAFALAAFTATDLQIQSGNSFPQQWMQAPAAGETYH